MDKERIIKDKKSFLIIGAGSLGCLFGAKLALAGYYIEAIVSKRNHEKFQSLPLILEDLDKNQYRISDFNILTDNPSISPDFCIISTKAYDLAEVCMQFNSVLQNCSNIFLLQNGIGNEEILLNIFPNQAIFRIISSNGALLSSKGHIIHTGYGPTVLCDMNTNNSQDTKNKDTLSRFFDCLTNAGLNPKISENPLEEIWSKAFINIGINAFGALTQLQNGDLLKIPGLLKIMQKTVEEAINIAKILNIPLDPNKNYICLIEKVLQATKKNKNSMFQDILKGKRTEIAFLNQKIVNYGYILKIKTPYNEVICGLIEGLEFSNQSSL